MSSIIAEIAFELSRHRTLVERCLAQTSDEHFFHRPGPQSNSIALVIKHLAGNLYSRWSAFGASDGDKPLRDRDAEFVLAGEDSRAGLMAAWERGWLSLQEVLDSLKEDRLGEIVLIRGEPHRVQQALLRALDHVAYHAGQILYVARWLNPTAAWITIEPGKSREHTKAYLQLP